MIYGFTFQLGRQIPNTKLTPVELINWPKSRGGNRAYICRCICGQTTEQAISKLRLGKIKSCGCSIADKPQCKPYTKKEAILSFWEKVTRGSKQQCWIWNASKNQDGYGTVMFGRRVQGAHRVSWLIHNNTIPNGLQVLHKCDNPACVNPDHLFLGTQRDNMLDCAKKGRIRHGDRRGEKHPRAKLTNESIKMIRKLSKFQSRVAIGRRFGVCRQAVDDIVNGKNWSHI